MFSRCIRPLRAVGTALSAALCLGSAFVATAATPVEQNGLLQIKNGKLSSASGAPVQLRGMSLFWSQWSGNWWNASTVNNAADWIGCDIIRAAMGAENGGYLTNPDVEKARVNAVVQAAIDKGIYVIIDWHLESATTYPVQAQAFFTEMATNYKNVPNVLFEIYNEPTSIEWPAIKSYAEGVISAIRGTGANNVVIVGTKTWSQEVDVAAANPINMSNVAYTVHFYAASHGQDLRDRVTRALALGQAVVATEWGTCAASGGDPVDAASTANWMKFLEDNQITWCNWSLFDKPEAASFFKSGTPPTGPWTDANLSPSGQVVKAYFHPQPKNLVISPSVLNMPFSAGSGSTTLTAAVSWTATPDQSWISVSPASGSGNATLKVGTLANSDTATRSGKVKLVGSDGSTATLTVNQDFNDGNLAKGRPTTASSSESASYKAEYATDGDETNTRWASAFSDPQWLMVDLGSVTSINKVVLVWESAYSNNYEIQVSDTGLDNSWKAIYSNPSATGGKETLTVSGSGRYIRVYCKSRATQYGASLYEMKVYGGAPQNHITPDQTSLSFVQAGGSKALNLDANVAWTATSDQAWLSVTPASGSSSAALTLNATANTASVSRSANLTFTGSGLTSKVTISQDGLVQDNNIAKGKPATASSNESASLPPSQGNDGLANTRWSSAYADNQYYDVDLGATYQLSKATIAWEAAYAKSYQILVSDDHTTWTPLFSTTTGAGGTTVHALNGKGRYVRLNLIQRATQWGFSFWEFQLNGTLVQNGPSLSPASLNLSAAASANPVALSASDAWTATSSQAWLTVSPAGGTGNGSLSVAVAANPDTASRSGQVVVTSGGQSTTLLVSQAGKQASLSVSPEALSYLIPGGAQTVTVTASSPWTASSSQSWLSVTPAGSGTGSMTVTADANPGAFRSATVSVTSAGLTKTVAVTQSGQGQGPVKVTASQGTGSSQWYSEDVVSVNASSPLTAMTLSVTVLKSAGASFGGAYNTLGGTVTSTYVDNGSTLTYTFKLAPGATLSGAYNFVAQLSLNGTPHAISGDTWSLAYTSGGVNYTMNGSF